MKSEVASLSTDFHPTVSEDFEISSFEQSELDIISSFYGDKYDSIDKLRERFKRVSGVMLDTSKNSHGFSLSEKALKSIADHFEKTKNSKILHRKFLDHKYQEIEKQVGKLTKIWYDDKAKVLRYKGIDDKKHPTIARSDSFNSVSATIAHGDRECSACGTAYRNLRTPNCSCTDAHPVSNKAMDIELSYVSFPAYSGATSQVDEFSGDIQSEITSFFSEDLDDDDDGRYEDLANLTIYGQSDTSNSDVDPSLANAGEFIIYNQIGTENEKRFVFDFNTNSLRFEQGNDSFNLFNADTSTDDLDLNGNSIEGDTSDDDSDAAGKPQSTLNELDEKTLNKIVSLSKSVKELRELLDQY